MAERKRMTTRFKELFEQKTFFVMAGGMNPIGAKMAETLGYEVFYMSGGNTAAHQLGWPDSGSSMRDMVDNARKIVLTVHIPVFSAADTGYYCGVASFPGHGRQLSPRLTGAGRGEGQSQRAALALY